MAPSGPTRSTDGLSRGWLRAAVHPVPLALLAAGGIAATVTSWTVGCAGALAYALGVAVAARARNGAGARVRVDSSGLAPPVPPRVAVRSTEVMAHVVRIRKAHQALYDALRVADPTTRALLAPSYERVGELVEHSATLARKADALRVHLDATVGAHDQAATRPALEREYGALGAQLTEVAAKLEGWQAKVLHMRAEAHDAAASDARELLAELEQVDHLVAALAESSRG